MVLALATMQVISGAVLGLITGSVIFQPSIRLLIRGAAVRAEGRFLPDAALAAGGVPVFDGGYSGPWQGPNCHIEALTWACSARAD
jgi:hypothetical protein